jgi:hypothetical protein
MSSPIGTGMPPAKAGGNAVTALVLGVAGFFCCNLVGPVAWYMGHQERKAIRAGLSSPAGDGMALAGMILGIIDTILLVVSVLFIVLWILVSVGMLAFGGLGHH